ncbi:hypothetical protein BXZ70DRAFT_464504 [Cristinia sonorae]|uniref:Hemerythrin-like domain-containing protein n=1 Tax=Cristinia sonorae TaxID=1940300 RepID=A0A8K0XM44_9AGAR|nr:hypothetical protein BXZ70DRAFT_464504 [Cristinia sonorae]
MMADTLQTLRSTLDFFIKACHGPKPTDGHDAQYWTMAGIHAFILNGLISIYEQAATIPEEKAVDFCGYALQWTSATHHHHHVEETAYFPMFSHKFDTSFVEQEHSTFTPGLEALDSYLVSCLPTGAPYGLGEVAGEHEQQKYDGSRVISIIDSFAEPLCKHLIQEVNSMEPDKLRAAGLTEAEMQTIAQESMKQSKKLPLTTIVVYSIMLSPKEIDFPPFSSFLRYYVVPYVLAFPNRRWWQFAPKN